MRQGAGHIDNRFDGSPLERDPDGDKSHLRKDLAWIVEGIGVSKDFTYRLQQGIINTSELP